MVRPWLATIDIKPALRTVEETEHPTHEQTEKVAKEVARLIREALPRVPAQFRSDWKKAADDMEEAAETQDGEEVDYMLGELYALGDVSRVFLGA